MRYWNGFQWRDGEAHQVGHAIAPEPSLSRIGDVTFYENDDGSVVGSSVVLTKRPEPALTLVPPQCEVDGCDLTATTRVGDAVNVCDDHVATVIEDGDVCDDIRMRA